MNLDGMIEVLQAAKDGKSIVFASDDSDGWDGFKDKIGLMKTNVCSFYCLVFVVILYFHNHRAMIGQATISKWVLAFNFSAVGDGAISSDTG